MVTAMRFSRFAVVALGAAICFSACEGTFEEDPIEAQDGSLITISASNDTGTRSSLIGGTGADRNKVTFTKGDALSVCTYKTTVNDFGSSQSNVKFQLSGNPHSDGSADFTGMITLSNNPVIYAMYPYQEDMTCSTNSSGITIHATIPKVQKPVKGSYDPAAALSAGKASQLSNKRTSISLTNLCCLIKFTVPEGCHATRAEFADNLMDYNNLTLAGNVDIKITNDGAVSLDVQSGRGLYNSEETVILEGEMEGGNDYYFVVAPIKLQSMHVTLYDGDKKISDIITNRDVTLKRSQILNLGVMGYRDLKGRGLDWDPYLIENVYDLITMKTMSEYAAGESYYYRQTQDIDCEGRAMGIGSDHTFRGHYDGGGHTISNYKVAGGLNNWNAYAGLFSHITNSVIENLSVQPATDASHNVMTGPYAAVGCLAGIARGNCTISNCTLLEGDYRCSLSGADTLTGFLAFGGLVGTTDASCTFSGCTSKANLTFETGSEKTAVAGGILGFAENDLSDNKWSETTGWDWECQHIRMDRCRNTGSVTVKNTGFQSYAGGILGYARDDGAYQALSPQISNCVNKGSVSATATNAGKDAFAGGIIGYNGSDGFNSDTPWVHNCLNTGTIYAYGNDASSGGIIGCCYDYDTQLALCINVGSVSGGNDPHNGAICGMGYSGGLFSYEGGTCYHCFWITNGLPLCYEQEDSDKVNFNLGYIDSEDVNDYIFFIGSEHSGWTTNDWHDNAAAWKGSWGMKDGKLSVSLDLEF